MNYNQSIKYVKDKNSAVFAVNIRNKELISIVFNSDPDNYSDIIVFYNRETGPYSGEEGNYSPDEFAEEFKDKLDDYDFIPCKKTIEDLYDSTFDYILEVLDEHKI